MKFRRYIDFVILACCLVIAFNIHPSKVVNDNTSSEKHSMIYIFHDYAWNEYIMNDKIHWASSSWDYLFNDEVPDDLKWDDEKATGSVSLGDLLDNEDLNSDEDGWNMDNSVKDNQISLDDIISELWLDSENINDTEKKSESNSDSDILVISIWDDGLVSDEKNNYIVKEVNSPDDSSSLVIEKTEDDTDNKPSDDSSSKVINDSSVESDNLLDAKAFTFIEDGRVLPALISRNDLLFDDNNQPVAYINNSDSNWSTNNQTKESGITIIEDYKDCMTPWWYKIHHWDSVLAYKQMEDALDICNIERRFCWKWKLSGTYTQQWCSVNKNYTYEQWWDVKVVTKETWNNNIKWGTRQNSDGSVTVKNSEIWVLWSTVFDRPNSTYTDFRDNSNNIKFESSWVEQTTRSYEDCVAPRWERVQHWHFIQAFKHENWFSDAPCEAQIRLCTMWELMWTYTESTCKTWDTSFIDWVNGSPTRKTYSEEKLDLVRKQIKDEKIYYNNARENAEKSTDSDVLDRILYILDQD